MSQNALTVTPPNPTPPTNFSFTGVTGPNPPNFTKLTYADAKNWGVGAPTNPPPYFDDGTAGSLTTFAANTSALAGGSGATAGGTEGTYPGTGSPAYTNPNNVGATPASTSAAHEGAGTEVTVTATSPNPNPYGQLVTFSDLGSYTNLVTNNPNTQHASSFNAAGTSTITGSPSPNNTASGAGTITMTLTGTNYRRDSVVYIDGIPQTTQYISATSLQVTNAPKRATAGTRSVTVLTGGVMSSASTWTFT